MWPFKKKESKYSRKAITYVLSEILRQTVDREILRDIVDINLQPLVGNAVLTDFYIKLNEAEKKIDTRKAKYWLDKMEILKDTKAFNK